MSRFSVVLAKFFRIDVDRYSQRREKCYCCLNTTYLNWAFSISWQLQPAYGPYICDVPKEIGFFTPSPCPHEPDPLTPLVKSTCGRHKIGLHIALLKWLVQ